MTTKPQAHPPEAQPKWVEGLKDRMNSGAYILAGIVVIQAGLIIGDRYGAGIALLCAALIATVWELAYRLAVRD